VTKETKQDLSHPLLLLKQTWLGYSSTSKCGFPVWEFSGISSASRGGSSKRSSKIYVSLILQIIKLYEVSKQELKWQRKLKWNIRLMVYFSRKRRRTVPHYIKNNGKRGLKRPNTNVYLRRPKTQITKTIHQIHTITQKMWKGNRLKPFPKWFWWLNCPTQIIGLTSLL
jgi:hypothetical protein